MSEPNALPALAAGAVNDGEDETSSDMASRHKKELRGLEMQHRSSLKKISKTAGKGKKGKELLVRAENEYGRTRAELEARHFAERSLKLALKAEADVLSVVDREVSFSTTEKNLDNFKASSDAIPLSTTRSGEDVIARRRSKNKKKKQDRRIAEKKRDESIAAEIASAGPSFREIETEAIVRLNDFNGRSLTIREVGSDGHCLFRAVGLTTGHGEGAYGRIRSICADALSACSEEYAPFAELPNDGTSDYASYVESVRSTSLWGGQLEIRALSAALRVPIVIFSDGSDGGGGALLMGGEFLDDVGEGTNGGGSPDVEEVIQAALSRDGDEDDHIRSPIFLSYHRHYYALGEHYNAVIICK